MSEHLLPSGYRNALFIDLDILIRNYKNLTSSLLSQEPFAVVKAEAYGHGGVEVARAMYQAGARWFGVAAIEEAESLRAAGVEDGFAEARILVMSDTLAYNAKRLVEADCDAAVWRMEQMEGLARAAKGAGKKSERSTSRWIRGWGVWDCARRKPSISSKRRRVRRTSRLPG